MPSADRLEMTQDNQATGADHGGAAPGARGRQARPRRDAAPAAPATPAAPEAQAPEATARPARGDQRGAAAAPPTAAAGRQPRGARAAAPERQVAEDLTGYVPRLKELYNKTIVAALQKELSLDNVMEVPKVTKVVLNMGMGESLTNPKALESAERDLTIITGQKPVITKAKKSIANFKIRQGMPIGIMVTLRGNRMYEFLDRLFNIALPRVRDFRGAPNNGFDGRGNYSMGVREQVIFPEIDFNSIDRIRSFQITLVTTARNDDASRKLLTMMGLAFSRERDAAAA